MLFANMYLAYELLSDSMKSFLGGLTAMHDGGPYVGAYKRRLLRVDIRSVSIR